MSHELKEGDEEMSFEIAKRAKCGRKGNRINRRFNPDTILQRLEYNRLPRKSAFTCRKPSFKDVEGRKYYRDAPFDVRAKEKRYTSGWYHLVLPVRRSIEDEKVSWPEDGDIRVQIEDRCVHVRIGSVQKANTPNTVVARVYLVFEGVN